MEEKKWTLGEDLVASDNLLDPITFEELITTVRCNCREITSGTVRGTLAEIINLRFDDMKVLLENSMEAIISEAKKGRG